MIRKDMNAVLRIEQESFEYPWGEDDFIVTMQKRNCIGMIATKGDRLVGYMIYEFNRKSLDLLNFAVNKADRRSGVGTAMVQKLAGKLSIQRRSLVRMHVCEDNLTAQLFFKSLGFRAVDIIRSPYESCDLDAYLMQMSVHSTEPELAKSRHSS